jgi:hypothetical protein
MLFLLSLAALSSAFRSVLTAYELVISIVYWPTGPSLSEDEPTKNMVQSDEEYELEGRHLLARDDRNSTYKTI